jgi:LmbE family N-acetylglucosaminyl deacetylase
LLKINLEKIGDLKILCLGAHVDDIEIGSGGTILRIQKEFPKSKFYWVVFSGSKERTKEALISANTFLEKAKFKNIDILDFKESYFPFVGKEIKDYFETLKSKFSPHLVLTHYMKDAHQDHRLISQLTWNTFRNNLILEYEIPKYDGDLGNPNFYTFLDEFTVQRKIELIYEIFQSQREKIWFTKDTFRSIMRIRGVESNSLTKYAEAFYSRKLVL